MRLDIGDADAALPADNDIVSAMSVLLHIVDDARFARATAALGAALRLGGALITIDPAVVHGWWGAPFGPDSNSRARPIDEYRDAFAAGGLQLDVIRPATILLSNVIDTRRPRSFKWLDAYWSLLMRAVGQREWAGSLAGALIAPVDGLLARLTTTGPSAKLLLARRAG